MAAKKKAQTKAEQTAQEMEQDTVQAEPENQEQEATATAEPEQDGREEESPEEPEQDSEQEEPERNEFAGIPNPCVYCGPSVRGVARQYTTYMGGIPEPLKEFIRGHPAVRRLIVPTAQFAGVRKRLETPGTAEAIVYKKVKSEL